MIFQHKKMSQDQTYKQLIIILSNNSYMETKNALTNTNQAVFVCLVSFNTLVTIHNYNNINPKNQYTYMLVKFYQNKQLMDKHISIQSLSHYTGYIYII